MAENAERDEDKDEDKDEDEGQSTAETKAETKAETSAKKTAPAPAKKDTPAAKPSATTKPKPAAAKKAPSDAKAQDSAKKPAKALKAGPKRAPAPSSASLGKSMVLFVVIVGTLAAGFALLGQERGGSGPKGPTWKVGDKVDVEITLVASDKRELGCASADEVAGRHCGFEAPNKPWTKGDPNDDKKVLRPYTSTDNVQFVAAGLWSEPALAGNLPATRFTVKCKYQVEGKVKNPTFHWESGWEGQPRAEMLAGAVTGCTLLP